MPPTQTVRIVNRDNSDAFGAQRMEMFAARKQVFIDGLKWDLATTDGLYEIDEYDHEDTVYLIVADPNTGSHLGSVRLLPTDGPHLLGDKFAQLCEDGVPRAADVYEITRLVTRPGLSREEARQVRQKLAVAVFEYALAHDVRHFTMMTHMVFLSAVIAMGWNCEPLGLPQEMDGVLVAALRIDVDAPSLARLRAQTNLVDPVLMIDLTESALVD
jgi:N-acyl-L-homoserine lactone synthetase